MGAQRARREHEELVESDEPVASQTRRPVPGFYDRGYHELDKGEWTTDLKREVADEFGVTVNTVDRWINYVEQERVEEQRREGWSEPKRLFPKKWKDLTEEFVPALYDDFAWFRGEFFQTEDEEPYVITDYHEEWIKAILECSVERGRLMILSPPRHGKTELLSHLVVWLVCRFPNIRVVWVGPNDDIAQDIVGQSILEHFEDNKPLEEAFCPPGESFKPKGRGRSWTKSAFTVATRTVFGIKSPTARFQGRGTTLVSRDADLIICDDIEQDKTVNQPGTREATRMWASTSLFSRKTAKTAIVVIGSRQHPDDLWQHFLDNPNFTTIIEVAHDPNCEIPQNDPARYSEHVDCMLWPEVNNFAWLKEMEQDNELLGGADTFKMVYLNQVTGLGMTIFEAATVAACRDDNYRIGEMPTPVTVNGETGGLRLIAGLDPSGRGYQAAVLWAVQVRPELRMWLMDIENREGGGIAQARETVKHWYDLYKLSHWVVEENLYQGGILKDEMLMDMRSRYGIHMEPHHTGVDKWDPFLGVSTLKPLFVNQQIVLPYGDVDSVVKSDAYQKQLVVFADAPRNRNAKAGDKSDLVMASWFPMKVIRRWKSEFSAEMGVEINDYSGFEFSDVPWDTMLEPV